MSKILRGNLPPPENNKSLPDLSVRQGQIGDGSAPLSLSRAGIRRAHFRGCRIPDAILHGKRSFRPRSRAGRHLSMHGFRVRLFSSLQLVVAPPACKPGQDTPANRFRVLTTGSRSAIAFGDAFARSHGSRLFTLKLPFISQSSGVVFNIAGDWKFFTEPAEFPCSSRCVRSLCPPFGVFRWAVSIQLLPPEPSAPC
jgi:hypothetical protein